MEIVFLDLNSIGDLKLLILEVYLLTIKGLDMIWYIKFHVNLWFINKNYKPSRGIGKLERTDWISLHNSIFNFIIMQKQSFWIDKTNLERF